MHYRVHHRKSTEITQTAINVVAICVVRVVTVPLKLDIGRGSSCAGNRALQAGHISGDNDIFIEIWIQRIIAFDATGAQSQGDKDDGDKFSDHNSS